MGAYDNGTKWSEAPIIREKSPQARALAFVYHPIVRQDIRNVAPIDYPQEDLQEIQVHMVAKSGTPPGIRLTGHGLGKTQLFEESFVVRYLRDVHRPGFRVL